MRFTVPQFIEHEAKIVGPLTFKQFIYVGFAGAIGFVLYYSVPFTVFLAAAIVLGIGSLALAFLKIDGRSLPTILENFLKFSSSPKIYLWQKKKAKVAVFKKSKPVIDKSEAEEEELSLKIAEKSQLKKLSAEIDVK